MDIQDFMIFKTVAKNENISKAAEELSFVQSSITSKIKRLEKHYQTQLFYRHRYGVTLTPSGKVLLEYADKILHLFNESEKEIMYSDIPKGPVSIGSMETTAAVRLPIPLASFSKEFPDVNLSLKTGPTDELIKLVLDYELDGAFVASTVEYSDLVFETVIEEELLLISNEKKSLSPKNLKECNLLVFRQGCSYRRVLEEWLRYESNFPKKIMEFGSLEAIMGCVNAGLGISLLPKSVILKYQQQYTFHSSKLPNGFGNIATSFVYRKDVVQSSAVKKFIAMVRESNTLYAH